MKFFYCEQKLVDEVEHLSTSGCSTVITFLLQMFRYCYATGIFYGHLIDLRIFKDP